MSEVPTRPSIPRGRDLPWWKSALFSLVALVLVLGLAELALTVAGVAPVSEEEDPYVGFSGMAPLFVERRLANGEAEWTTAPNKLMAFNAQRFSKEKGRGTYRVLCLGGSTTYGKPYTHSTSFPGWLGELLAAADSTRHWEVVNAGGVGYASYRIAEMMKELVRYDADLFVVYTGHNEFLERRTYRRLLATPGPIRALGSLASRTRLYTAVSHLLGQGSRPAAIRSGQDEDGKDILPAEVDAILDRSVGPTAYHRSDEWHEYVLRHFDSSLRRVIMMARRHGAQVIVVTPASNLGDCTPFHSEHGAGVADRDAHRVEQLCDEGQADLDAGRADVALAKADEAIAADARYAMAHFLRGRALVALGRAPEALKAFVSARDEDVCPLRAPSRAVEIVREVADETHTPLVDVVRIARERSADGIPGARLFLDYVHPTIEGNRMIALAVLDGMTREGIVRPSPSFDEATVEGVIQRVEGSIDREARGLALVNLSRVLLWAGKYEESDRLAREAQELIPDWSGVHYQLAQGCARRNDVAGAVMHYRKALEAEPGNVRAYHNLGVVYANQFKPEEAIHWFREGLKVDPDNADLHLSLGAVLGEQRRFAEAKRELEIVVRQGVHRKEARALLVRWERQGVAPRSVGTSEPDPE